MSTDREIIRQLHQFRTDIDTLKRREYPATSSGSSSVAWPDITGKPTTIAGYGITDAATRAGNTFSDTQAITKLVNGGFNGITIANTNPGTTSSNNAAYAALILTTQNLTGTESGGIITVPNNFTVAVHRSAVQLISFSHDHVDIRNAKSGGDIRLMGNTTVLGTLDSTGRFGLGVTPAAVLHLKAGTATPNAAPLKFNAGTVLTTPENGTIEYSSAGFFSTHGGVRTAFGAATSLPWAAVTGTPTTIAGYGITDAATRQTNTFSGTQTIAVTAPDLAMDVSGGTSKFSGVVDVWVGALSVLIGADSGALTRTDTVTKVGRIGTVNASSAAAPVVAIFASNTATANSLFIGGGTGAMTAATAINLYTGATPTTTTGTRRMTIDESGNVGIGASLPLSKLDVNDPLGAILTLRRQDTSVTLDDMIGKIQFWAADTSTTTNFIVADIEAQAVNTVTTDINPGRLIFRTTPNTVAAVPIERMRIAATGEITFTGHMVSVSTVPTIAANAGAGTTPTISITGSDHAGSISLTTGTSPTASADVFTVTFGQAFAVAPKSAILQPANAATAALGAQRPYVSSITTTTFVVAIGTSGLTASTAYKWYFQVL